MKKLLFLLLLIPLVSFGQNDIDYSSQKSIFNYLESNSSDDILVGLWDNPMNYIGAVMINKIDEKKYAVIACAAGVSDWEFIGDRQLIYGDTLAILEKSIGNKKIFISSKRTETTGNRKNRSTKEIVIETTIDYPSLSKPTTMSTDGNNIFFIQDKKLILKTSDYRFRNISSNYTLNDKKEYLSLKIPFTSTPFIKKFPVPFFDKVVLNKPNTKTGEWAGNGSGIIISKSGYIITNHHVIEDADDIEVEFIINDEVQKFNAEIVQSDKVNDLAIIKIFDINFDGLDNLPYNFKARSSDVGTKVYAYGYPMALSLMGKEIKVTDGMINSKTGYGGNVTTYQITAPIQPGNSGGPLFDDKGNFIGINSAGLSKDVADNVGYTIKSSYVLNLIDVLPKSIDLPSSTKLQSLPLTEQIKEISKYVVLVKVK